MLLTLLLAACYDYEQDVTTEEQPVDILSRFNAEGKAYLTIQIPIGATTRAATFDDGSADEYKVKDIYILMFAGSSESDATFASAYKVETPTMSKSPFAQITTTATIALNDANLNSGNKLFPFVVVNNNAYAISAFSTESVTFANNGSAVTLTGGSSNFSALANVSIANYVDEDGYFLMTNATLADDNDVSQARVFRLPELDPDYFFPTEDLAKEHPAGQINVERLSAKATVENGLTADNEGNYVVLGNKYAKFVLTDLSFALDNYNTNSYAFRHLSSVDYVRMVESTAITPFSPQSYRTYWGEDMNYSGETAKTGLHFKDHANRTDINWINLNSATPMYCAENTFNVANMKDDCTTSVLVRLQLNKGDNLNHRGDFYTISVTGQDVIFQPPTNDLTEEGTSASESFVRRRSKVVTYDGSKTATIDDYLRTWLMEQSAALRNWVRDYAGNEKKHLKIEVSGNAETGLATATLSQTAQTSGTGYAQFEAMKYDLQALLNSLTIKFYDEGYCYYRVLIRHFDDTQTPWSSATTMSDNSTAQVYNGDEASYLGRYGMVRNNWYNISINSVTHVGSPIIPPLTTNADDKVEQLLNATLHISGWEKHEQNL